jgi:hypothetical protein
MTVRLFMGHNAAIVLAGFFPPAATMRLFE